ncbi:TFIIA-alpha and beta-like factor [Aulostomus maculatus]
MLTNSSPVAKLYLSIIDDVIENMRELFLDEGLEDRVLDDLKHLWESKLMQSKALEDFRRPDMNSSNFVLQLAGKYSRTEQELRASVVVPASQNIQRFPNTSETIGTFSLPAGLTYPVQIPAGVTLQTASGQLYKVNVPVVVTQAPAAQLAITHKTQREGPGPQLAEVSGSNTCSQEVAPLTVPTLLNTSLPPGQGSSLPQQPPAPETSQIQPAPSSDSVVTLEDGELSPQPVRISAPSSPCGDILDFQTSKEDALPHTSQLEDRDIDDILKEVIQEEREKALRAQNLAPLKICNQPETVLGLDLGYNYGELSDIVQLDGPADSSDIEEEEQAPLEENDFLGLINEEAVKALQEREGSSNGSSMSSCSDGEGADELANVVEEDPLNSEDDVTEQDIPDLFDTENVIVCQYDKIHRSKNRWKFLLKDGVMCYGGRDYVFSKAVGEAEW